MQGLIGGTRYSPAAVRSRPASECAGIPAARSEWVCKWHPSGSTGVLKKETRPSGEAGWAGVRTAPARPVSRLYQAPGAAIGCAAADG